LNAPTFQQLDAPAAQPAKKKSNFTILVSHPSEDMRKVLGKAHQDLAQDDSDEETEKIVVNPNDAQKSGAVASQA
jgi:hypothetical protein